MAQWLGICLTMQGHRLSPWWGGWGQDPTGLGTTKPTCHARDLRLVETRRVMTKVPKTLPCYRTIKQSENWAWITYPMTLSLRLSLKTLPWKPMGEFLSLEHELPVFFAKSCNKLYFLHYNLVSVDWLRCTWVSGPTFCWVTSTPKDLLEQLAWISDVLLSTCSRQKKKVLTYSEWGLPWL